MKIQERYQVARNTSSLKIEERTSLSSADVLTAAGMAGLRNKEALQLWEVAFQGKTSAKMKLIEMLEQKLAQYMIDKRLIGNPRHITIEVIAWYLHGTCQPCGGKGYEINLGTPTLSDRLCKHCHGTGKVKLPDTEPHRMLNDYMGKLTSQAAGQIMKKLAFDMDL